MRPGGFRSSLLTLCSSMIGVGFLTLPVIGKNNGLYPMIGLILLAAFISCFANWQIGRGFRATGGKTYSKIVARVDGRVSGLVSMIFLFFYVYVSAGAYYVFGKCFPDFRRSIRLECRGSVSFKTRLVEEPRPLRHRIHHCFLRHMLPWITAIQNHCSEILHFHYSCGQPATRSRKILPNPQLLIYEVSEFKTYYKEIKAAKTEDYILNKEIFGSYCLSLFSSVNQFSVVNVLSEYMRPTGRRVNKVGL